MYSAQIDRIVQLTLGLPMMYQTTWKGKKNSNEIPSRQSGEAGREERNDHNRRNGT